MKEGRPTSPLGAQNERKILTTIHSNFQPKVEIGHRNQSAPIWTFVSVIWPPQRAKNVGHVTIP